MFKAILLGFIFWALTYLFPEISISGFWTIAGVITIGFFINLIYKFTLGLILLPLRILTFGFVTLVINTGIVYLMAELFNKFTIESGNFWVVLLFTFLYTLCTKIVNGRRTNYVKKK